MQIKILDKDKIPEKEREEFLKFLDVSTENFAKDAYNFLDELYSFKRSFIYRPNNFIVKCCCYIVGFCIMFEFVCLINHYINFILYNYNVLKLSIATFISFIFQLCLLSFMLYNDMLHDKNYRHECYIKLINSEMNKKYLNKLLEKANELNIKIEVIKDKDDENKI